MKDRQGLLAAAVLLVLSPVVSADIIGETFEDVAAGNFPPPPWQDVGLVNPEPPNPPDPSVTVEMTTDAFGNPTKALTLVDALAESQGIYRAIPVSPFYSVAADVRVDRFSDNSISEAFDWAMEVGVGQFLEGVDPAFIPQTAIYASSLTQGWRLFVIGTAKALADIDLKLPVEIGTWYRVQMDLDAVGGVIRSRIWDVASGALLLDRADVIEGWTPDDGLYDIVNFFDGELTPEATVSNLAVIDNICVAPEDFEPYEVATFPAPPWQDIGLVNPEPPNPPDPSATVEVTSDAFGNATKALTIVEALAESQGIYRAIPVSPFYSVAADVRVDRFSDNSISEAFDWAMEAGVGQLLEGVDPAFIPQTAIYASSLTQGWRLFVIGTAKALADIDLKLPVEIGTWYRVQMDLDAVGGVIRSRIWDVASGALLLDRADVIEGWTPDDGLYDIVNFFDGELTPEATVSNLAVIDNICVAPIASCLADLDFSGAVDFADILAVLAAWGPCEGDCPEDLNGNGSVDFADLLIVLSAWGPCP